MATNMHHRVHRLEATIKAEEMCHVCGAPATLAPAVIITEHDDPLPKCESCGRDLNNDGRPLTTPYTHIILMDREIPVPAH